MRKFLRSLILIVLIISIPLGIALYIISPQSLSDNFRTNPFTEETITNKTRPIDSLAKEKQILWGDTHVHTTYSMDAFYMSLPMMYGSRGAFPPAFACDYARFISQLDFYVLTDHAESYTPRTWKDQVDSVRQCNAVSGDENNPDLVAFIGWEWTQAGATPQTHYGHHNVMFKDYKEGMIPDRPIASGGAVSNLLRTQLADVNRDMYLMDPLNSEYYFSFIDYLDLIQATPNCEKGIPSNYLPEDCYETADTPGELYAKLDDWGFNAEVIPHGTTWGFYTPQASTWKEYTRTSKNIRPDYNSVVEIYSGHGNSEQFYDFLEVNTDENGNISCPEPTSNYLPSCYQAGVIMKQLCLDEGKSESICADLATKTRDEFNKFPGASGIRVLFGADNQSWLDAGQARNTYLPAFNYRPKKSVQYALALRNEGYGDDKDRFRWGFIGSSDTHSSRAGHGFKQLLRDNATESTGAASKAWRKMINPVSAEKRVARLRTIEELNQLTGATIIDTERQMSFFTLGGLMAVHSEGRDRDSIWQAMKRKEVFATTGHRILVWFDLLDEDVDLPMGSVTQQSENPTFRVKAMGSFKQLPGCPDYVKEALTVRRLEKMADNECYNPSDDRYRIERIEIIRIKPQINSDEDPINLIEDVWKSFLCDPDSLECTIEFSDDQFEANSRDTLYYARVIEEDTPLVNGGNLRTKFDNEGNPISVEPCHADYRLDYTEQCLGPGGHRAWSSPIFIDYKEKKVVAIIADEPNIELETNNDIIEQPSIN